MEVYCYRNLNTGKWSLKARVANSKGKLGWMLIAHASRVVLADVSVKVTSPSEQRKAKEKGVRNVHLVAVGTLLNAHGVDLKRDDVIIPDNHMMPGSADSLRGITYNPFQHSTLVYRSTGEEFTGSDYALFDNDQKMYA